jgi:hypothetical protein
MGMFSKNPAFRFPDFPDGPLASLVAPSEHQSSGLRVEDEEAARILLAAVNFSVDNFERANGTKQLEGESQAETRRKEVIGWPVHEIVANVGK